MTETQRSISDWIEYTFGPVYCNARIVSRANEEMAELIRDVTMEDNHPNIPEEIADIIIVLCRLASRMNVDLWEEVEKKMKVNRSRNWLKDGSGCGYHIKG